MFGDGWRFDIRYFSLVLLLLVRVDLIEYQTSSSLSLVIIIWPSKLGRHLYRVWSCHVSTIMILVFSKRSKTECIASDTDPKVVKKDRRREVHTRNYFCSLL